VKALGANALPGAVLKGFEQMEMLYRVILLGARKISGQWVLDTS